MDFAQNYLNLVNVMKLNPNAKTKVKHNNFKNSPLFPFQTREPERVKFDNGFNRILGEFTRIELNKSWIKHFDVNNIVSEIIDNRSIDIEYDNEIYLEKLLKEYLFDDKGDLKILNPYLFSYIPLSDDKQATGEKDIALFLRDIFCLNNNDLINFFEKTDSNQGIINFILNNIKSLDDAEYPVKYVSILKNIVDVFEEDIDFAINHENFLITNISNIFAYYYFFYISQLILKINNDFNEKIDEIEELYFLLDWESVSKNRKTVNQGYAYLKNRSSKLPAKVSVVDQINILYGCKNYSLLGDIYGDYINLNDSDKKEFIKYLKKWISEYRNVRKYDNIDLPDDFNKLTNILFESLNDEKGIDPATKSRYSLNYDEISKAFFAKFRGRYGYVLNINRNMLLTLTALCVKDKRIKLKDLFKEYERRGVYFDKYSQGEIEIFLTNLNLIDKKSDSGDAKYVKPIL